MEETRVGDKTGMLWAVRDGKANWAVGLLYSCWAKISFSGYYGSKTELPELFQVQVLRVQGSGFGFSAHPTTLYGKIHTLIVIQPICEIHQHFSMLFFRREV